MKVLNFSAFLKHKLYVIIILSSIIGALLIAYATFYIFKKSPNEAKANLNIFNLTSYYAKCNVTVNSNKTSNIYTVEELYKKSGEIENFRFNYKDFMQNDYSVIVSGNKIKIINSMQISKYITTINNNKKENLYSLATYIDMIKDGCFKVAVTETEVTTTYSIYLKEKINDTAANLYEEVLSSSLNIDKVELCLISNMPKKITVLSGDKEVFVIDYTDFELNREIEDSLFEV